MNIKEVSQQITYQIQPFIEIMGGKLYVGDTRRRDEPIYVTMYPATIASTLVPVGMSNWSPSSAVGQGMRDMMFIDLIASSNDGLLTLMASMERAIIDSKVPLAASGVKEFILMPGDGYLGEIIPNRWVAQMACTWLREL